VPNTLTIFASFAYHTRDAPELEDAWRCIGEAMTLGVIERILPLFEQQLPSIRQ
jgi:hypothetical protein